MHILVTGATGYIGGRLVPRLLEAGHSVRVLVRSTEKIRHKPWFDDVEVHVGDVLQRDSLQGAGDGIDVCYYLVHSMIHTKDFHAADHTAAQNFIDIVKPKHVIYLGGLLPEGHDSPHLQSRADTGHVLGKAPITEFRAGPIIGSGSASFEMIRYLTERLPMMIAPKWIHNIVQPIGIRDVLAYLIAALDKKPLGVVDIGANQLRFVDMMRGYAKARGLKRLIVKVPVFAPRLAARWVGFVTPVTNKLALPLVDGMLKPVVANLDAAKQFDIQPMAFEEAVQLAIKRTDLDEVETRWTGAGGHGYAISDWENLLQEVRELSVDKSPESVTASFMAIGGDNGWYTWNWAWRVRGAFDRMIGGPGLRRGRKSPSTLAVGDVLDFWRVEAVEEGLLRLRAEMKLPGRAWLQFEAIPEGTGTRLVQTAFFEPKGAAGLVYWKSLYPVHRLLFRDMVKAIGRRA